MPKKSKNKSAYRVLELLSEKDALTKVNQYLTTSISNPNKWQSFLIRKTAEERISSYGIQQFIKNVVL